LARKVGPKEEAMNDTQSPGDRRHVRSSLIASLITVLTLSLLLAWHPEAPAATKAKSATANTVATAPEAAPDNTNENLGCGCAEPCYATN
jgi:hypothetical protein